MSEKQAIEIGQHWKNNYHEILTIKSVSPAWIKVTDEHGEEISIRRGDFLSRCMRWTVGEKPEPIDLGEDTPADNTSTHAAMQAAVSAFNAQTGQRMLESDGWLLMMNFAIIAERNGVPEHHRMLDLYQESREVD